MATTDIGPLDWRVAIVDSSGRPTSEFQRKWNTQRSNNELIEGVTTGKGAPTGTPTDGEEYVDVSSDPFVIYFGMDGSWHKATPSTTDDLPEGEDNLYFTNSRAQAALTSQLALKANLDSPEFTGTPTAPTAAAGTSTTQIATTEFVTNSATGLVVGFAMGTGATGTNVSTPAIAPRAGKFTKCKFVTKASDGTTSLTFLIKKNGTNIFSTNPTVSAGTSSGTVSTFTTLTNNPTTVAADDVFTLDITSGSSTWQGTIQLE